MKNKFKVGDRIRGLKGNGCRFTNEQMLEGKVVETFADNMRIKIENHSDADYVGRKYVATNSTEKFELIKLTEFTKSSLRNGDRVYDNDPTYEYGVVHDDAIKYGSDSSLNLGKFNEDLTHVHISNFDIIKVERPVKFETVFEREEEIKELTMEEVCEMAGCTVKIVESRKEDE